MEVSSLRLTERLLYRLPVGMERRLLYLCYHRRLPHFVRPVTFSEKVNWRIMNDRRPLLEWTCDKLAMKEYARQAGTGLLHVPRTFWSGSDISELSTVDLPEHWVLKPNHRSGPIYFGSGQSDCKELSAVTATWLDNHQSATLHEWAYSRARPMFLVEELLGPPGSPPPDYKIFVFDGQPDIIEMVNRYDGDQQRLYRPDWSPLEVLYGYQGIAPIAPRPPEFEQMLDIAGRLGRPFDFIRVDLYNVDGMIIFGELTPYPCGGFDRFRPASFDVELGNRWKLPTL
jgi:TupA-like ATPgrasp